jgi:hypothetical protein
MTGLTATSANILAHPHPCGHIVYPYTDPQLVREAVAQYASAGLRTGEGVVLIVVRARRETILHRLRAEGLDVEALEANGALTCLAAEDLLPDFMVGGMPDAPRFRAMANALIDRARASTKGGVGLVRVFGEMVCVLVSRNNKAGAARLEELWTEVVNDQQISLLCSYCLDNYAVTEIQDLCDMHTHNLVLA